MDGPPIERLIDEVIVLAEKPDLDDALILKLQYDLATQLHPLDDIAVRYGLGTVERLHKYLVGHPEVVKQTKKIRAALESDEGAETRVRIKALQATETLILSQASIAADTRIPAQQRIDAFKQLSRVGGVDGSQAANKNGTMIGSNFVLNIHFRDGSTDRIDATVATPPLISQNRLDAEDDGVDLDEEV